MSTGAGEPPLVPTEACGGEVDIWVQKAGSGTATPTGCGYPGQDVKVLGSGPWDAAEVGHEWGAVAVGGVCARYSSKGFGTVTGPDTGFATPLLAAIAKRLQMPPVQLGG